MTHERKLLILAVLINLTVLISANSRYCVSQETCDKCLDQHSTCSWCSDRLYDMRQSRCMSESDLKEANCRDDFILVNKFESIRMIKDDELRDFNKEIDSIQIRPQKVAMKLRKSRQQTVRLNYKPARNYPLDLYYLMDLTWTMRDDKKTLVGMGDSLTKSLSNLTENFRLGFGSFADKPIMPMILPGSEENPCSLVHETCLPTYGFKHKLRLTDDLEQFVVKVNGSEITGNLDNLEGGLDALMQILVCRDEIGWNDKTRKIVVFASDGNMHYAGDGLLAGIIRKNDKTCHLNMDGDYMASLDYDYPSLEEIYRELLKRRISVIFAVTSDVITHYYQMHSLMEEITSVGQLAVDSSNILQLVESGYREAVRRAQFEDNAPPYIQLNYRTTCGGKFSVLEDSNKCDNIEIGSQYDFDVGVTLLSYPEDGTKSVKIRIEEANIDSEAMEIEVEIDYPCTGCEALPGEPKSELCNSNGEWKCGSCYCDKGFVGKQCMCNLQEYSSTNELDNECRRTKDSDEMCSNHGECLCGQCNCNQYYTGEFCECDFCPIGSNGEVCGGKGNCDCGKCVCDEGHTGETCECNDRKCMAPGINQICSGNGTCECAAPFPNAVYSQNVGDTVLVVKRKFEKVENYCKCNPGFTGQFCESSSDDVGSNPLCIHYAPYVECFIDRRLERKNPEENVTCSMNNESYRYEFQDDISDAPVQCIARVRYDDDVLCDYKFTYKLDELDGTDIRIVDTTCPPVNVAAYSIVGVIIATFLLGLLVLMIIKFNIYLADKREFAKFEEERKAQTSYVYSSPIYKSPVSIFRNPQNEQRDSMNTFELQ